MRQKMFSGMLILFISLIGSQAAAAAAESQEIADLKKQIEALQTRVAELEAEKQGTSSGPRLAPLRAWDPFAEMNRIQEEMDLMFQNAFGRSGGAQGVFTSNMGFDSDFDLKETDEGYEITFDMQGLDEDKFDVQINERSITVKGQRSNENQQQGPNGYVVAQSYGSFLNTIPLPPDADASKVKTEKEGNNLIIRLPKKNPSQTVIPQT